MPEPWMRGQPPRASGCLLLEPLHDIPLVTEVAMRKGLIRSDFPAQPWSCLLRGRSCHRHREG